MKTIQIFLRFFSILFVLSLLLACSQQIQGRVFLDKNGNNLGDSGEFAIPGVPYTVTLDGATYGTGVTQAGGKYSITLDTMNSEGSYCVKVDSHSLPKLQSPPSKNQATAHPATIKLATSGSSESDTCPVDEEGVPDCNDENCCDESECEDASVCQESNEDTEEDNSNSNACPHDDNNQPICSDSRCSNLSACDTDKVTVKSMEACGELAKTTLVLTLDVPITMDYSSRIEKVSSAEPILAKPGDLIDIPITYPASCTFDLYTLPAPFFPEGLKGFFNEFTREFSLDKAVHRNPSNVNKKDNPIFGQDSLHTYLLSLRVLEGVEAEASEYLIQPSLICPDGTTVKAGAITIQFDKDPEVSLQSEILPACPAEGESATLVSKISNTSSSTLSNATLKIGLTDGDKVYTFTDYPDYCQLSALVLDCEIPSIPANSIKPVSLEFKMDDTVPAGSKIEFSPELTVDENQYTDSVITCNY